MIVLAIDTAANLCASCVYDASAGTERARVVLDIGKGHAERLMGAVAGTLGAAGIAHGAIDRIVVCVGPGSFTGVRVGVSAARGLALALKTPAVGVDALEGLAFAARQDCPGRTIMAAIDGRRGDLYCACYDAAGILLAAPAAVSIEAAASIARRGESVLTGSGAQAILDFAGQGYAFETRPGGATADISVYARLGAMRDAGAGRPRPLYLRSPDARPQSGFALKRADR